MIIRSGTRDIKTITGNKYVYYQYHDQNGQRKTKYCGPLGKPESEIKALEVELECMMQIKHQRDQRVIEISSEIKRLKNSI